jgi:hypothetical protein
MRALFGQLEQRLHARFERCGQTAREVPALCRGAHGGEHTLVTPAGQLLHDLVLGRKLQVHAADPDADLARNVANRGLARAVMTKQTLGRFQDLRVTHRVFGFHGFER